MEEGQGLSTIGIFEAYEAGRANVFFGGHFADGEAWERVRRVARPLVPTIASALEAQNAGYEKSEAREAHLRSLRAGGAAVVTGQQVGLFLGPLYTLYKAASTIRLARSLTERWGAPVVPIFWLQTEDHDAAEISVCHIARPNDDPLTLRLDVEAEAISVAHRLLPAGVTDAVSRLGEALASLPHGEEHVALLARHYRRGASWAGAFAGVLATLFAEEGLVLIDPRDPALASSAAPVHRRALTEAATLSRALTERVEALASAGFHAGVHVRDDAPLSFFHPGGPAGPRIRPTAKTNGPAPSELLDLLDKDPARFSTSALLRPILQDTWLPTAAYVAGPGEIAYFAQLAPLYAAFGVPMPIVVPRVRLRLLDPTVKRTLTRRALTPEAACRPFDDVLAASRAGSTGEAGGEQVASRLVAGVDRLLADVAPTVSQAGPRGERSLAKTRRSMARAAAKLGHNVDRALLLQDRELVDDVRRVQARLFPRGVPQERFFGLSSFAARHGQRPFVARVLAGAWPLRTGIGDLEL